MQNCNVSWSFNVRGIYERNHCYIQVSCSEFCKVLAQNLNLHFFLTPPRWYCLLGLIGKCGVSTTKGYYSSAYRGMSISLLSSGTTCNK